MLATKRRLFALILFFIAFATTLMVNLVGNQTGLHIGIGGHITSSWGWPVPFMSIEVQTPGAGATQQRSNVFDDFGQRIKDLGGFRPFLPARIVNASTQQVVRINYRRLAANVLVSLSVSAAFALSFTDLLSKNEYRFSIRSLLLGVVLAAVMIWLFNTTSFGNAMSWVANSIYAFALIRVGIRAIKSCQVAFSRFRLSDT